MKKRILSLALAFALALSLLAGIGVPAARAAEDDVTIKLHYHRSDGSYDGWDVWFWISEGKAYSFADENGEMVATFTFQAGSATQVGYIVRYGGDNWTQKDVNEDQFIDVTGVQCGTIHAYVESGVPGAEIQLGDDVKIGNMVTSATYDGKQTVTVRLANALTGEAGADTFQVKGSAGTVAVTEVQATANTYQLTLGEKLDLSKKYQIIFEGKEYDITMPEYFNTAEFEEQFTYTGDDLGMTYTKEKTTLRVWAPTALSVTVNLYTNGDPAAEAAPVQQVEMTPDVNGTWVAELSGDRNGTYYTYLVELEDGTNEACDPYARTTGVNGKRAMILDLDSTDPEGWDSDTDPHAGNNITDAVIYELHIRDLSSDASSGIENVGKYLGLIETGTTNSEGISTGLDHIKELGITHLHLLPVFDYGSVDESKLDTAQFNWGYDPVNYNVPEGSYSTDPYNGEVRVSEFKQMVKGLHDNGISVVMDVVYNHVYSSDSFCFNQVVPGYFSRPNSNGSGCGNDTASERSMVSKYIVDSVKYWADEYHIDGFRFDLVGLIDTDTINAIIEEVHKTHPDVIFYGEGWTMTTAVTKTGVTLTTQTNSTAVPEFAFFSDNMRDLLKGSVFDQGVGFVSGKTGQEQTLRQNYIASLSWTQNPSQVIQYASCHDNNTLFDRIVLSTSGASLADQIRMNNLAAAIYLTAQGVPFMLAGEEMLCSKPNGTGFSDNSYNLSDSVNSLKWDTLNEESYQQVFEYYKGLIAFRKAHPVLRLTTREEISAAVSPVTSGLDSNVVAFHLQGGVNGETAQAIYVVFNANNAETTVTLPEGNWNVYVDGDKAGTQALRSVQGTATVAPISALVLVQEDTAVPEEEKTGLSGGAIAGIAAAAVAAIGGITAAVIVSKKKKKN